jgi:RNA polymerase-associated protein RTF1
LWLLLSRKEAETRSIDSDEEGSEMDMDLESEEGEGDFPPSPTRRGTLKARGARVGAGVNPYPLEGKYIDEDDREE